MFSVLLCTVYTCLYPRMLFMFIILCVWLSFIGMFHIQLSYDRYWIFETHVCICMSVLFMHVCLCFLPRLYFCVFILGLMLDITQ